MAVCSIHARARISGLTTGVVSSLADDFKQVVGNMIAIPMAGVVAAPVFHMWRAGKRADAMEQM